MRERIPWIFSCLFFVLSYWLNICQPTSHHSWGNILEAQVRSKRGSYLWIHQMGNWVHGRGRRPGCDVLEQSHTLTARGWMGRRLADGGQPLGAAFSPYCQPSPVPSALVSWEQSYPSFSAVVILIGMPLFTLSLRLHFSKSQLSPKPQIKQKDCCIWGRCGRSLFQTGLRWDNNSNNTAR